MVDWLHIRRLWVARWLVGLFLVMQGSAIMFRHSHRLADGTIITHCHPYNPFCKGPFQPNNHSRNDLLWLAAVANALYDEDIPVFGWVFARSNTAVLPVYREPQQRPLTLCLFYFSERGPPNTLRSTTIL